MSFFHYDNLDGEESSYEADLGSYSAKAKKKSRVRHRGLTNCRMKNIAGILGFLGLVGTSLCAMRIPDRATDATTGDLSLVVIGIACMLTAIPLYSWIFVDAARHTEHPGWYLIRLTALAALCEVPWDMATWQYERYASNAGTIVGALYSEAPLHPWFNLHTQNPIWALAACELVIICFQWIKLHQMPKPGEPPKKDVWLSHGLASLLRLLLIFAVIMWLWMLNIGQLGRYFPMGLMTFVFVAIFYAFPGKENTMILLAAVVGALEAIMPAVGVFILHFHNDEEGYNNPKARWAWYPLTFLAMLVLGLVACWGLL